MQGIECVFRDWLAERAAFQNLSRVDQSAAIGQDDIPSTGVLHFESASMPRVRKAPDPLLVFDFVRDGGYIRA